MGKVKGIYKLVKEYGDDLLEIFFDDEITATQDFVINNFAVTSLVNAAGLLILFLVIIWFHNEIKYGKMSLSLAGKINRSTFRYAFAGNSFMCVVMLVVTVTGLVRFTEMAEPPSDTDSVIAFLYLVEWLTFLIIGLTFVVFGTIWSAARSSAEETDVSLSGTTRKRSLGLGGLHESGTVVTWTRGRYTSLTTRTNTKIGSRLLNFMTKIASLRA